jgi:broad specificity phosphatase PhoE
MHITLIRHLPTEWNHRQKLQGRRDIGLSPITEVVQTGIRHNQQLLNKLSPFDVVLASTLKRTHQTAQLYGYQAETESLLDELDFGPFEGLPKEKIIEKYGDQWIENPKELVLGESLSKLEERIILFLNEYRGSANLLVFSHGAWTRAFLSYVQYGHINKMNQMTVANNQCITLQLNL